MRCKWVGFVYVLLVSITFQFSACSLEGESVVICELAFDGSLLDDPPVDTVFIEFDSEDISFKRKFSGLRKSEIQGNPVDGAYENLFQYGRSPSSSGEELRGIGVTIINPADSSEVTLSFNLQEITSSDAVCRRNKTLQAMHQLSRWFQNKPGVELILTIRINGEWTTFSTDTDQENDFLIDLVGAEMLDQAGIFARLQGTFRANMIQIEPESTDPMTVEVSGSFIVNTQISYLF